MVERILANYKDIDDKANQALEFESESEIFNSKPKLSSRIKNRLAKQGSSN
jgi:hypothetical protein